MPVNRNYTKKNTSKKCKHLTIDLSNCAYINNYNSTITQNHNLVDLHTPNDDLFKNLIISLDTRCNISSSINSFNARKLQALLDNKYISMGLMTYDPAWGVEYTSKQRHVNKKKIIISDKIDTLQNLIDVLNKYPLSENIEYNADLTSLYGIKTLLCKLNNMVGMEELKRNILDQIIYYSQGLHKTNGKLNNGEYMHTVIYGPPGTGKTEIAKLIGEIFSKLGILKKKTFKKVTRSDLIAGYLGQTALKTTTVIKEAIGGVLFIDEAYALGNAEKKDTFAKECIDTLCEALSDKKEELMVIIAGYEEELKTCFFNYNSGLESRFVWRFKTSDYSALELKKIFLKLVHDHGWECNSENIPESWFEKHLSQFKNYGRDMENLLTKTKIAHGRRIFCCSENYRKGILEIEDVKNGYEIFIANLENVKKQPYDHSIHMYV